MRESAPSQTAIAALFLRALHLQIDDVPAVLDDHAAIDLLPPNQRAFLRRLSALPRWWRRFRSSRDAVASMRAQVVVRSRYAEDVLASVRPAGARRYVVLAAGLDTFALRQREPRIDVVEIDHPATQRWKVALLAQRGVELPSGVTLLPIDFERQRLEQVWVDADGPEVISWLGTTYYLTRDAIVDTLTTTARRTAPGSRLVLDFWREPPPIDPSRPLFWGTRMAVALQQEPMRSFFDPDSIGRLAESTGWQVRETCRPADQNQRYLAGRRDRLAVPSFAYLLHLAR